MAKGTRQTPGFLVWQRGQGNFELAANYDYIHAGRLTRAKVCVGVGSQSLPLSAHQSVAGPGSQESAAVFLRGGGC